MSSSASCELRPRAMGSSFSSSSAACPAPRPDVSPDPGLVPLSPRKSRGKITQSMKTASAPRKCQHKSSVPGSSERKPQKREFKRKSKSRSRTLRRQRRQHIQPSGFSGALDAGNERVFSGDSTSPESSSSAQRVCDFSECLVGM